MPTTDPTGCPTRPRHRPPTQANTSLTLMHANRHPLSGAAVVLRGEDTPATPVCVDDWLDREPKTLPTAAATHTALEALWDDDAGDLLYGRIGSLGVILHQSEIDFVTATPPHAGFLLRTWERETAV